MSVKQLRKMLEKLDDALDDIESDLEFAAEERDDYSFRLGEKEEEMEQMAEEIRLLCRLIYDAHLELPMMDHFIDINPYVPKDDPNRGNYKCW